MNRQEAIAAGEKTYTGKPCKKCGGVVRYVLDRNCIPCSVDKTRKYYAANSERISERSKKYYEANAEKIAENQRKYYAANAEKIVEKKRKYRETHPEKAAECNRKYYETNAEKIAEYRRKYREDNPEKIAEYRRKYREDNPEKIAEKERKYREANAEKISERSKKYYEANAEKILERTRKYQKANPEKIAVYRRNRRARKRAAEGTHTAADIVQLLTSQKSKCAVCRKKLTKKTGYHVDHIMPLSKGGSNDRYNLQILCPTCNLSKNAKHPIQFMQQRGYLL